MCGRYYRERERGGGGGGGKKPPHIREQPKKSPSWKGLNIKSNIYVNPKFRFVIYAAISKFRNNYPKVHVPNWFQIRSKEDFVIKRLKNVDIFNRRPY